MGAACYHGDAAPPPPTCTAAAEHVRTLIQPTSTRANKIRDVFLERCGVDGWSAEVRECVVATRSLNNPQHCKAKLTVDQRAALDRELSAPPVANVAIQIPPACRDYQVLIEKLGSCTVVPPSLRAMFEQGYRELAQEWGLGGTAGGTRRAPLDMAALEAQCRVLANSVRSVVASACGW